MAVSYNEVMNEIVYKTDLQDVDWAGMKETLEADDFHNGRTVEQLRLSFENSFATVIVYANGRMIGTARALSDGVCNAYIVDVWTLTEFRRQGVASQMMKTLLAKLEGQHVCLFTDDMGSFYKTLGFAVEPDGYSQVVGRWLQNETRQMA